MSVTNRSLYGSCIVGSCIVQGEEIDGYRRTVIASILKGISCFSIKGFAVENELMAQYIVIKSAKSGITLSSLTCQTIPEVQ